ncbi:unnamed protein product [Sphagnum jensenii]|uniref:Uncharacterized protein n=1 Tax=Sphagnum jensenii TaxID=128206 RepID=A0ABP1AWK7_9BRYO
MGASIFVEEKLVEAASAAAAAGMILHTVLLLAGWLVGLCQEATKPHRFQSLCIRHRVSVVKWGDQQLLGTFLVLLPTANPDFSLGTRRRAQEAQKGQPCTRPLWAAGAAAG